MASNYRFFISPNGSPWARRIGIIIGLTLLTIGLLVFLFPTFVAYLLAAIFMAFGIVIILGSIFSTAVKSAESPDDGTEDGDFEEIDR
jgi:hypothetical protein